MPSAVKMRNAPAITTVAAAGLLAAINAATAGAVITVTAGAPLNLNLAGIQKPGYGVTVLLPFAQQLMVTGDNVKGITFMGGTFAANVVQGNLSLTNYGILLTNSSRISFLGCFFSDNFAGCRFINLTDLTVRGCCFEKARNDGITATDLVRAKVETTNFADGPNGQTFCYYNTGAAPVEGLTSDACTGGGGTWLDSDHRDMFQFYGICSDIKVSNNYGVSHGQGHVQFGDENQIYRLQVDNNVITNGQSNALFAQGEDIYMADNTVTQSAMYNVFAPQITVYRNASGRISGGRNTSPGTITSPSGVNLGAGTINGDAGVVPPAAPLTKFPNWIPATPAPTASTSAVAPSYLTGGAIRCYDSPAITGSKMSIQLGAWYGYVGATWEYQFLRGVGGPVMGTAAVYTAVAGDVGSVMQGQVRMTNGIGNSGWVTVGTVAIT